MIAFLLGLQGSYIKHSCFLCLRDSRADEKLAVLRRSHTRLPQRFKLTLEERSKILFPPLRIKLGLVKQFVKSLKPTSRAFHYIGKLFPSISKAKFKGGIFVGPRIRRMLVSEELERQMFD